MTNISIEKITFAHLTLFGPKETYKNYSKSRGVCGIVVVLNGSAEYFFQDGSRKIIKKGEIALFSDKSAYVLENTSNEDFVHFTINFTLNKDYSLFSDESYYKPENIEIYADYCRKILEHIEAYEQMRALSVLYNMLADVFSSPTIEVSNKSIYKNLLPAVNHIETEYQSHITTEILAKKCMMSDTSFRRNFSHFFGASPIEYLLSVRLERATQLLRHTTLSVSEISALCGFKNTEYFSRTFKKRIGKTASAFRKG